MFRVEMDTGNGGWGWNFKTPEDVYENIVDEVGHDEAANVQGWCELASIGEVYEGEHFQVYVMEND